MRERKRGHSLRRKFRRRRDSFLPAAHTSRPARALLLVSLFLLDIPASAQSIRVTDDVGWVFRSAAPPRRIVSLAPNITEILFALGCGERIIGVTRYCDFPPAALKIEKIGGLLDPSMEKIKSLSPDLVIAFRGNPLTSLRQLKEIGVPVFTLDIKDVLGDIPRLISRIGQLTGKTEAASRLNGVLAGKRRAVETALARVRERPRVFLSLHGSGLWTFGRDSYFGDLLRLAGSESITSAVTLRWFEYGRERLIEDDPDLLIILARSEAEFHDAVAWFRAQPGIKGLRAVREGRFLRLDQDPASRFGPRLFDTLSDLARRLHPELF